MNTTTQSQNFAVTVSIDKTAALLAGIDEYGPRSVAIKPSQLSPKQRETLEFSRDYLLNEVSSNGN
ncbi:MAG: hypothetical protein WAW61_09580 [Methylococcaceae bacterium]